MVVIDDLPQEILEYILYFVSPYDDLKSCRLVCQRWYLSCLHVVKKKRSTFCQALKSGVIEWYTPSSSSNPNSITRRYSHSACIHDSYMYVFGGCTATNTTFNDLWKFHLGTNEWTRLLTTGTYPSPKAYASMVTCGHNLVLFGGWTHPSVYPLHQQWVLFNELHTYNIISNRWTQLYYGGSPPPTAGHTASVQNGVIVIFGGLQRQEGLSTSTNDVYCLNIDTGNWFKPRISGPKPQPRYGHSQIKLNERHLLIMAGCGGSNKLYNDIWLLYLPSDPNCLNEDWRWESVTVEGLDNMPSQIWYNPACKVDNSVVILSTRNLVKTNKNASSGKMHQLFVPDTIRRQSANVCVPAQNLPPLPEDAQQFEPINNDNCEVNINGQRGFLRSPPGGDVSTSSSDEGSSDGASYRHRAKPSIRPNASSDREKMLQVLSRMEKKIKTQKGPIKPLESSKNRPESKGKSNQNVLVPHLLDITRAISCKVVIWLPVVSDEEASYPLGVSPKPCLLHSLLMGRGHLVMFGGIPNDPIGSQNQEAVSNHVNFISAPLLPAVSNF